MKIILLGMPGSGKGTIAKIITKYENSIQISTGDILRSEIKKKTELGEKVNLYIKKGNLVPDKIIISLIENKLSNLGVNKGFILDGFPRTIKQAKQFIIFLDKKNIILDGVINLSVPQSIIIERLNTRRTCSNTACQEIYNVKSNPPDTNNKCKKCGSLVIQRSDETKISILNRIEVYKRETLPLIEFYNKKGLLQTFISLNSQETANCIINKLRSI